MPNLRASTLVGIRWEIKVSQRSDVQKQVLKVETVDVNVDRTNFVLYLVYLFRSWSVAENEVARIVKETLHALDSRERCC
jgi:hypothetical protein